ncbi:MAG: CPBP family intramembrane metalloprotease [Labilithrix sp.]|nr:CPBP family intramembrane metalloprotease [Labilithrix sp.]
MVDEPESEVADALEPARADVSAAAATPEAGAMDARRHATDGRRRAMIEALTVSAIVTGIVTAGSAVLPDSYVAMAVGLVFLGATWAFVWRGDDARVEASGLALGGLVLPGKLDVPRLLRAVGQAVTWALVFAAVTFVPFYFGWQKVWHPRGTFALGVEPMKALNEVFGQLVIIALPEEAFYRGYLQSRLDEALPGFGWRKDPHTGEPTPRRLRFLGASVGPALLVTSAIFALGHFATIRDPARLAVFFPSLAFGFLRYRTKGIGAGIAFHAMCNVFSELLGKGFRVY